MDGYVLETLLRGTEPVVRREFWVPDSLTFHELHNVIQRCFQWQNRHLYRFVFPLDKIEITSDSLIIKEYRKGLMKVGSDRFEGTLDLNQVFDHRIMDAREAVLKDVLKDNSIFTYVYDFGDVWVHEITLKESVAREENKPVIISLQGVTPPEDVGGIIGYDRISKDLHDSESKGHRKMMDWAESKGYTGIEPDIEKINIDLSHSDLNVEPDVSNEL